MEIYTMQRPSLLPTAACAPSASWRSRPAFLAATAAERAQLSRVHQVPTQAELVRALVTIDGGYGINGFVGNTGVAPVAKRMTDGASGVPPRGRPV